MLSNQFEHQGELWTRYPVRPVRKFFVGLDLGQSSDPTAICVLEWLRIALDSWTPKRGPYSNSLNQDEREEYRVRHLQRLPLGLTYPAIIAHVQQLMSREPLRHGAELIIDQTGVGAPVADSFDAAGLEPIKVHITAGSDQTKVKGERRRWNVSKTVLVSGLDAKLHSGELRIAAALAELGALRDEIQDFHAHVRNARHITMEARSGKHDDLVLAVALAVWRAMNQGHEGGTVLIEGLH